MKTVLPLISPKPCPAAPRGITSRTIGNITILYQSRAEP